MHQYKTVSQILLIISIFNLVFAVPVVRQMYDAHDNVVLPVVVRTVADGTPFGSSPPPLDGSPPPSHSSSPPQDGLPSGGAAPLHESPSPPPGGPAALAVSSSPGETASLPAVPVSDEPVPTSSQYTAVTHDMLQPDTPPPASDSMLKKYGTVGGMFAFEVALAATVIGGLIWRNHHKHHSRMIDPDWYVSNSLPPSYRHLNVPNH